MKTTTESDAQYIIGIDLGTTNSTLAYVRLEDDMTAPEIQQFPIPQITDVGTEDAKSSLPSFLYLPLEEECSNHSLGVSWDPERTYCVGTYAKTRGEELPNRLIASAKSWLCHTGIDRREPTLPWGAEGIDEKLSPVSVCARYLAHLREAWDAAHEEAPLAQQKVLVTVPASFDPSARQLVEEACAEAKIPGVILLEEPQAAFYSWLHGHSDSWRDALDVGDKVLVADVGGGTTDFSLISVQDHEGDLQLERIAVGTHLLLGGDNMDLALAYCARQKLEDEGHELDDWQFQSLVHAARRAKEELLGAAAPESVDLTLQGRGSSLISSTLKVSLTRDEAQALLVDGFAPLVEVSDHPQGTQMGMRQVGLPYAEDARITSQLAQFLSQGDLAEPILPNRILFNGGTFKAEALKQRLCAQLQQWAGAPVRALDGADLDNAVSRGAVYYGLARMGQGIRIKGGTSRSYFIAVEEAVPAVPGLPKPLRAVCIAPLGMEEGTEQHLEGQEFALVLGESVKFRFFSYAYPKLANGEEPQIGTVVRAWKKQLCELHPIEAQLDRIEDDAKTIRVRLLARVTELGVLELWCESADERSWKLEFDVREEAPALETAKF